MKELNLLIEVVKKHTEGFTKTVEMSQEVSEANIDSLIDELVAVLTNNSGHVIIQS